MSDFHNAFETYLRDNDLRYTQQKKIIVDMLFGIDGHIEIESFLEILRNKNLSYSRATVYRTVRQLLDAGLLQKVQILSGKVLYEPIKSNVYHAHAVCNICGDIIEILEEDLGKYVKDICEKLQFKIDYQSIHIYGSCRRCSSDLF